MKPIMFEAIMFLKYNSRFWGEKIVAEALRASIFERSKRRLQEHDEQIPFDFDASQ